MTTQNLLDQSVDASGLIRNFESSVRDLDGVHYNALPRFENDTSAMYMAANYNVMELPEHIIGEYLSLIHI